MAAAAIVVVKRCQVRCVTNGSLWPLGLAGSPICTQKQGHKFLCCKCKSRLVSRILMARNSPPRAGQTAQYRHNNCLFRCCYHHADRRLPKASMIPLGSPVIFTAFTMHPSRGCTAATGPCTRPDRIQCLSIECERSSSICFS